MQAVRFFKRSQVLALKIFDEPDLQRLRIVHALFDARNFMESGGARGVVAPLARDQVVAILARHEADEQRFEHAFLAH